MYGIEQDGLRELAVYLLWYRVRSYGTFDQLPEGVPVGVNVNIWVKHVCGIVLLTEDSTNCLPG